jgi:hypothetical protein
MSTVTTRAALVKPATSEFYDVTIFNANADKIDNLLGFTSATSTTRPSTPITGQGVLESDTGAAIVSNGSSPASASWSYLHGTAGFSTVGAVGISAALRIQTTSALSGNRVFDFRHSGDVNAAHIMDFDGRMQWGPGGSGGPDVNLYRSASGVLKTDQALSATNLTVSGSGTVNGLSVMGVVGGKRFVTGGTIAGPTSGTTEGLCNVDTGSISYAANSEYLVEVQMNWTPTVANDTFDWIIRDTNLAGAVIMQAVDPGGPASVPRIVKREFVFRTTTAVPSKTFVASVQRTTGTGTASITASSNGSTYTKVTYLGPNTTLTEV